jgi:hypothetical protein
MNVSVRQTLADLRAELEVRIADAWRNLERLEAEMADTIAAQNALRTRVESLEARGTEASLQAVNYWRSTPPIPVRGLTMKSLVVKALSERFKNGATSRELLDFIRDEWGRTDVIRSSFSPQLSRLKLEGVIRLDEKVWKLGAEDEQDALLLEHQEREASEHDRVQWDKVQEPSSHSQTITATSP